MRKVCEFGRDAFLNPRSPRPECSLAPLTGHPESRSICSFDQETLQAAQSTCRASSTSVCPIPMLPAKLTGSRTAGGNAAFHNFHNDYAHIADPNERRRLALAEIDKAPFGWYHVRAILVAGIGFFTGKFKP